MSDAMLKGHGARDCVMFATADWDAPYWTNKQHMARSLARRGWRVLYVESPGLRRPKFSSGTDWARIGRRLLRGLRSVFGAAPLHEENIWVLSPLMIPGGHHRPAVNFFNQTLLKWSVACFARKHEFANTLVWTYHPFMLDSVQCLGRTLVYHCVDDLAAVPGINALAFYRAHRRVLRQSEVVFTTSQALREQCLLFNANTHYFGNVADAAHFGRALEPGRLPDDLARIHGPRIVYHGVLSDFKVDFDLLLTAACRRPDWQWILIGDEREGQKSVLVSRLRELPNVHLLGYRRYEELPEYLRGMDVGLLPTLLNDYTRSMFPMKFFEYLAAGLPVVSTPLDFTQGHFPGLEIASTPEEFVAGIERQLQRGRLTAGESRSFVGDSTWDVRVMKMLDHLSFGSAGATRESSVSERGSVR